MEPSILHQNDIDLGERYTIIIRECHAVVCEVLNAVAMVAEFWVQKDNHSVWEVILKEAGLMHS